jgi:hypothetical protein
MNLLCGDRPAAKLKILGCTSIMRDNTIKFEICRPENNRSEYPPAASPFSYPRFLLIHWSII